MSWRWSTPRRPLACGIPSPRSSRSRSAHGALTIVDCVTSLGGVPVDMAGWGADVCYSGSQKCLGAPSGLAPIAFAPPALERRVACRSFYLDVGLLQDYWIGRKYHHTMSSSLIYALDEALTGDRGGRARGALGAASMRTASSPRRSRPWTCRCCRQRASGCQT